MTIEYTPINFADKDLLPSGDSGKIIRGSEFYTEFLGIRDALLTAATDASPTFTGTATFADILTANFTSTGIDDNATATAVTIDASQNVGINNPAPSSTLDVKNNGSAYAQAARFLSNADALNWARVDIENVNVTLPFILFQDQDGAVGIRNDANEPMLFYTNGLERARLDENGNVGIGTASPLSSLSISGQDYIGAPTVGSYGTLSLISGSSLGSGGSITFGAFQSNEGFAAIKANLADGANNTNGSLSFYTREVTSDSVMKEAMRIVPGGNLGVGTSTPTAKLTVAGGINEQQYNLTDTVIDPANGTIQYTTLTENTTFTESLTDGDYVTLMIDDGDAYTVTWPTISWVGGSAPVLEAAGYNIIELWQVNGVVYGAFIGAA